MDIPFPSQLQWVTPLVGSHWPAGSESAWWRTAGYLHGHAAALEAQIPDLTKVRSKTQAVLVGETAQAFDEQFAQLFAGNTSVDKVVEALRSLGDAAESLGSEIQYTKLSIYSMLVIAAGSIVFALANSEWTLGASLAQIPVIRWLTENAMTRLVTMVLGRIEAELAARLGSMLVARLMVEGAVSAGIGAAQEGGIEGLQVAEGHRDGIDVGKVLHSAFSMGLAGMAGGWAGHEVGGLLGTEGSTAMRALKGAVTGLASGEAANVAGTLAGGGNVGADTLLGGAIGVVHGGLGGAFGEHGVSVPEPTENAVPANAIDTHPTLRFERQPDGTFAWPGETTNDGGPQAHTASPTTTTEPPAANSELGAGAPSHALPAAGDPGARSVEATTTTPAAAADAGHLPATSVTAGLDAPPAAHASVSAHLPEGTLDPSLTSPAAHTGPLPATASPMVSPLPPPSNAASPATPAAPTVPTAAGPSSPAQTVPSAAGPPPPVPTSPPASPGPNAGLSSPTPGPHAGAAEISAAGTPSPEPAGVPAAGRVDITARSDAGTHETAAEKAAAQPVGVDPTALAGRSGADAHLLSRSEGTRADSGRVTDPLTTRRDPARPESTRDDSNRPGGARPTKLPRRSGVARDVPEDLQPAAITRAPHPLAAAKDIGVIKASRDDSGPGPGEPELHQGGRDSSDDHNTPDPATAGGGAGDYRGRDGGHRGGAGGYGGGGRGAGHDGVGPDDGSGAGDPPDRGDGGGTSEAPGRDDFHDREQEFPPDGGGPAPDDPEGPDSVGPGFLPPPAGGDDGRGLATPANYDTFGSWLAALRGDTGPSRGGGSSGGDTPERSPGTAGGGAGGEAGGSHHGGADGGGDGDANGGRGDDASGDGRHEPEPGAQEGRGKETDPAAAEHPADSPPMGASGENPESDEVVPTATQGATEPGGGPSFAALENTGVELGTHGAQVWRDPSTGDLWLVKKAPSFGPFLPDLDVAVNRVIAASGVEAPATVRIEIDGTAASAQHMYPGAQDAFPDKWRFDPGELSDEDLLTLQKHHALDWLFSNHDSHPGQFIRTQDGQLVGIDKGQSYKYFGQDRLDWEFHPNSVYGEVEPIYNTLYRNMAQGGRTLLDPRTGELGHYVQRLQSLDDEEFVNMLRPYAEAAARAGGLAKSWDHPGLTAQILTPNNVEGFLRAALDRKHNLADHMGELYDKAATQATRLHDPSPTHQVSGERLPDLTSINNEFRHRGVDGLAYVFPDRFDEWASLVSQAYPGITPDHVKAIYDYSFSRYSGINPYLRNSDPLSAASAEYTQSALGEHLDRQMTEERKQVFRDAIALLDRALASLPPYRANPSDAESTTYRGLAATGSLLAQMQVGNTFRDPTYLSTAKTVTVASDFIDMRRDEAPETTDTLITVVGRSGVDVSSLTDDMGENEVLFPRGTEFEITSRVWNAADHRLHITMREKTTETGDEQPTTALRPDAEAPTQPAAEEIGGIKAHRDDSGPGPGEPVSHKGGGDSSAGHNTPDLTPEPGIASGRAGDGSGRGGVGGAGSEAGGRDDDASAGRGDDEIGDGRNEPEPGAQQGRGLPDLTSINNEFRDDGGIGVVFAERFDEWASRVSRAFPRLTSDHVKAIYEYTHFQFSHVNRYLRNFEPPELLSDLMQAPDLNRAIAHIDDVLATLLPYRADPSDAESTTYRGLAATDSQLAMMEVGNTFQDPAYLSTTTDVNTLPDQELAPGFTWTLITVVGRSGVEISSISTFLNEREVLFPRGTEFEITSREWNAAHHRLHITMREKTEPGAAGDGASDGRAGAGGGGAGEAGRGDDDTGGGRGDDETSDDRHEPEPGAQEDRGGNEATEPAGAEPSQTEIAAARVADAPNPAQLHLLAHQPEVLGTHGAQLYADLRGQQWLGKTPQPGNEFMVPLDVATSHLLQHMNLACPETYAVEFNGRLSTAVKWLRHAEQAWQHPPHLNDVTPQDLLTLQKHQALDWLFANRDAHVGQYIRDQNGDLVGIDKGQACKYFGRDRLDYNFHPNYYAREPIYNNLWREYAQGAPGQMLDPRKGELGQFVARLQDLPDDQLRSMFHPYAAAAADAGLLATGAMRGHPVDPMRGLSAPTIPENDPEAFLDALVARKNNLANDLGALYDKANAERAFHQANSSDVEGFVEADVNRATVDMSMADHQATTLAASLNDPSPRHEASGERLPDLTAINDEFRDTNGHVPAERGDEWASRVSEAYAAAAGHPTITPDEVLTIYRYTLHYHLGINIYLRHPDPLSASDVLVTFGIERAVSGGAITRLDHALANLPRYRADPSDAEATTYRGLGAVSDSVLAEMQVGSTLHEPAYLSTSTDVNGALSFASESAPTLITVVGRSGVDISSLSDLMIEGEVLFPRDTEFEIISREWNATDDRLDIVIREKTANGS